MPSAIRRTGPSGGGLISEFFADFKNSAVTSGATYAHVHRRSYKACASARMPLYARIALWSWTMTYLSEFSEEVEPVEITADFLGITADFLG